MKAQDLERASKLVKDIEFFNRRIGQLEDQTKKDISLSFGGVAFTLSQKHADEVRGLLICLIKEGQITRDNKLRDLGVHV